MNYNDYDSNGNKKRVNITDMIADKQKRSILILVFYLIIFAILVIFIRLSLSGSNKQQEQVKEEDKKEEVVAPVEQKEKDSVDELFSYIDNNNYSFTVTLNDNGVSYISEGKRFDNKFNFTFTNGEQILTFLGTKNNIKFKSENEKYIVGNFPYVIINYYDNEEIKKIIRNATNNNGLYEISNAKFYEAIDKEIDDSIDKDRINTIELVIKNNKVVGINLDISSIVSEIEKSERSTKITIEYQDFGLIDDFEVVFE